MKILWAIFLIFLIVVLVFGAYAGLFAGSREYQAAVIGNDTFVGEATNYWPTMWIVVVVVLVIGVCVLAFKR